MSIDNVKTNNCNTAKERKETNVIKRMKSRVKKFQPPKSTEAAISKFKL